MKKKCPNCGSVEESKFCTTCGQDLTGPEIIKICPKCGTENTSKFCTTCGMQLTEPATICQNDAPVNPLETEVSETISAAGLYKKAKSIGINKVKDLERNAEIKRAEKELAAEARREEQIRAAEARRVEEEKIAEIRRLEKEQEIEKVRIEKEAQAEREKQAVILATKQTYEEALTYLENAEKSEDAVVAASFFRKSQELFMQIPDWEDSDEKSLYAAKKAKEQEILIEVSRIKEKALAEKERRKKEIRTQSEEHPKQQTDPTPQHHVSEDEIVGPDNRQAQIPTDESQSEKPKKSIAIAVVVLIVIIVIAVLMITGRGNESTHTQNTDTAATNDSGSSVEEIDADFEKADIFSFKQISRDDKSYDDDIINTTEVTNNGNDTIFYFVVTAVFYDANGNEICNDSRVCSCTLKKGHSALVKHYSDLEGQPKSNVNKIEVTSYSYRSGNTEFELDLQTKTVSAYSGANDANVDFNSVNILSFETEDQGIKDDYYEVTVKVKNDGDQIISNPSFQQAYYDNKGNYLAEDARSNETSIKPGKYSNVDSYLDKADGAEKVVSHEITSYSYELTEDDKNGYNRYEINLLEKTAYGYHE